MNFNNNLPNNLKKTEEKISTVFKLRNKVLNSNLQINDLYSKNDFESN
jgi:hypothetical protein